MFTWGRAREREKRLTLRNLKSLVIIALMVSTSLVADDKKTKTDAGKSTPGTSSGHEETGDFVTEKRSDGTTVKYKKKTTYDFEGSNIEGLYNKPSGSYISNIKDVKGKSILRIRENFDAEVIDSSRSLR
jgi:hypothetical protein